MTLDLDLEHLAPPVRKVLTPGAPLPMRIMAAKGIIPGAKPVDIVTAISALAADADAAVAKTAEETLNKLPPPMLAGALQGELQGAACAALARHFATRADVVEGLLRQRALPGDALELLATLADEGRGELIATNEQKLLEHPGAIEKLYMNRHVRMSTSTRLVELAVRNGIRLALPAFEEVSTALLDELIPEPSSTPDPGDELFRDVEHLAEETQISEADDTHELDEEGAEKVKPKFVPLYAKLSQMTVTEMIRVATLGTSAERLLLVRSPNRLVSSAAVKSPLLRENDAIAIAASRSVGDEVLRILALNREMTRSYQVKLNLIINPRTPFTFASQFIPMLRDNDLRLLAKSKHVSSAVNQAARRQLMRKQGKTKD